MLRRGDVYSIKGGIIVVLLDTPKSTQCTVNCMIIGGTSGTYPVGSYDIVVFLTDLATAIKINEFIRV